MQRACPSPCYSSAPCWDRLTASAGFPHASCRCFPCSSQVTLTSPTLARSGATLPCISASLGNLRGNPFWAGKTSLVAASPGWLSGSRPHPAAGNSSGPGAPSAVGSDGCSAPDGWDRLAPGAAGPLPWQWQDIAFLQPPRSHKASRWLRLCSAQGCAAHTKRSWLSSVPGWEPARACGGEAAGAGAPCLFPTAGRPRVFAAARSSSSFRCSCTRPSCFLFPPCFSIAKSSPRCFFHLMPVTSTASSGRHP